MLKNNAEINSNQISTATRSQQQPDLNSNQIWLLLSLTIATRRPEVPVALLALPHSRTPGTPVGIHRLLRSARSSQVSAEGRCGGMPAGGGGRPGECSCRPLSMPSQTPLFAYSYHRRQGGRWGRHGVGYFTFGDLDAATKAELRGELPAGAAGTGLVAHLTGVQCTAPPSTHEPGRARLSWLSWLIWWAGWRAGMGRRSVEAALGVELDAAPLAAWRRCSFRRAGRLERGGERGGERLEEAKGRIGEDGR